MVPLVNLLIVVHFISLGRICSVLKRDILVICISLVDWGVLINNFRLTIRAFKVWSLGGFIHNHL